MGLIRGFVRLLPQSGGGYVPTRSVGTIAHENELARSLVLILSVISVSSVAKAFVCYRSHAPRGNATCDALRRLIEIHLIDGVDSEIGAFATTERWGIRSHAERGNDCNSVCGLGLILSVASVSKIAFY